MSMRIWIACFLSVITLLNGARGVAADQPTKSINGNKPFILFWCGKPETLKSATAITPQVWTGKDTYGRKRLDAQMQYKQSRWIARGILPLRWKGGSCYRDRYEDELVASWKDAAEKGYLGIAVDEYGPGDDATDRKLARVLLRVRKECPQLFIAAWHAGQFTKILADAYRTSADVVMSETYVADEYGKRFARRVDEARRFGIIRKTVFGCRPTGRRSGTELRARTWRRFSVARFTRCSRTTTSRSTVSFHWARP